MELPNVGMVNPRVDFVHIECGSSCEEHQVWALLAWLEAAMSMPPDHNPVSKLEAKWLEELSRKNKFLLFLPRFQP